MPGYDKTGPRGKGPMTGRGMGECIPERRVSPNSPAYYDFYGTGYGRGFGREQGVQGRGLGPRRRKTI